MPAAPSPSSASSRALFGEWKAATAALAHAEANGATGTELVRLSEEVIRTRNLLTEDWLAAGLDLPAEAIRNLTIDELLVDLPDDTGHRKLPSSRVETDPRS